MGRALLFLFIASLLGCDGGQSSPVAQNPKAPSKPDTQTSDPAPVPAPIAQANTPTINGESLLANPPEGWRQAFQIERDDFRIVEYVPADTDPNDWGEKLSFESFRQKPLPDPIEFITNIATDQQNTCEKFVDHNTFSGLENGYPTSVRLMVCYVNPVTNKGQVTMLKTILGNEQFYVITRATRTPPMETDGEMPVPEELMAEWSVYLRAISLCDSDDPEHPCPS